MPSLFPAALRQDPCGQLDGGKVSRTSSDREQQDAYACERQRIDRAHLECDSTDSCCDRVDQGAATGVRYYAEQRPPASCYAALSNSSRLASAEEAQKLLGKRMSVNERTYSREEFATILERAKELERGGELALGSKAGFSLADMREIAAEAGIDPDAVEKAARLLPQRSAVQPIDHSSSGLIKRRLTRCFAVRLTPEACSHLLSTIRASSRKHGEGEVTTTGLSWTDRGGTHVSVHEEGEQSHVQVSVDRSGAVPFAGLLGLLTGWVMLGSLGPTTAGEFFGSVFAGLAVAGTLLGATISRGRKHAETMMTSIAHAIMEPGPEQETPALRPGPTRSRTGQGDPAAS